MTNNIKKLVLASIFVSLAIIFTRFTSFQLGNYLRLGLGDLPILLAGIILGPLWGAAVGALSDVLGFFTMPLGDFFIPGITLSAALWGFIPGIIVRMIFKKKSVWAIVSSCVACGLMLDIGLTPLWLSLAYGSLTYTAMLPVQAANAFAMMAVNSVLTIVLIRSLERGKIITSEI
jgi:ECF transporter S component (folate family)